MRQWVESPNLPKHPVTAVAVSSQAHDVIAALEQMKIRVLRVPIAKQFAEPVASHADMQCHLTGHNRGICANTQLQDIFCKQYGGDFCRTSIGDFLSYPKDCSLNAARVGPFIFANPKCVCSELKNSIHQLGLTFVPVHQGYTKCSMAVVKKNAIMTADAGIAAAARKVGFDVLLLQPGHVLLSGYSYGFIGGTCGKLSSDVLAFAGSVKMHPQAAEIFTFLKKHNVKALSLCKGPLRDIGGILPLIENK